MCAENLPVLSLLSKIYHHLCFKTNIPSPYVRKYFYAVLLGVALVSILEVGFLVCVHGMDFVCTMREKGTR